VAPTITSVTPDTLRAQSGEWFMTLQGTHYLPTTGVSVVFTGPITIGLAPSAATDTNMSVWVPQEVLINPGDYSVVVRVPNGAGTLDSNPVTLHVTGKYLVLHVPPFVLAEAINLTGGPARFEVTASGFLSDQVIVDCSHKSDEMFPFDSTVVDCTASDDQGNDDKASFTVRVADTQPPVIDVPRDLLAFGKADGTAVMYAAKATDVVDPEVKLSCLPESGAFFRVGTASVTCSSTDRFKNTGTATFRIHVGTDEVPAMVIPSSFTAEAESASGAAAKFDLSATTVDGKAAEIKCDPAPGSLFPMGTATVKCTAWGPTGASTTDFFDLTVADRTAPALSLPRDFTEQAPEPDGKFISYGASAKDLVDGETGVDCFPASGTLFAPGQTVVNCSSTDKQRNTATGSFVVTVLPWVDTTDYLVGDGSSSSER
jgi:hypothetical protein